MINRWSAGAVALAVIGGAALAETTGTPAPQNSGSDQTTQNTFDGQAPQGQGRWWGRHRHLGWHGNDDQVGQHGGPMGKSGMMGMMHGRGFRMHLAPGVGVDIMCGQTELKDCIATAQPLIDAAKAAAAAQPGAKTP